MNIKTDYSSCLPFVNEKDIIIEAERSLAYLKALKEGSGKGNDFLGWMDMPENSMNLIPEVNTTAARLRSQADITVVIGIGGSYLGAKAVTEALNPAFGDKDHELIFAGYNISGDYHSRLLDYIDGKVFNIIVISKSGTTTEPAIAFRLLRKLLEKNAGNATLKSHVVAITDAKKGALKELADQHGFETYVIPDDVGGRYSVFTPVGLLPVAVAGHKISEFVEGALEMAALTRDNKDHLSNPALMYAGLRNVLYRRGKFIEMLVNYDQRLHYIAEWWKQLFGESEGKEGKGIFPASADFTTDLHSLGQYIQEGERIIQETVIDIKKNESELVIPHDQENLDKLNYIAGKRLSEVNEKAMQGTTMAHVEGGVPVTMILIPALNEYYLGQLLYFFEISCAISGYILGVNPFDQPGVEAYKKNMFRLLGK